MTPTYHETMLQTDREFRQQAKKVLHYLRTTEIDPATFTYGELAKQLGLTLEVLCRCILRYNFWVREERKSGQSFLMVRKRYSKSGLKRV